MIRRNSDFTPESGDLEFDKKIIDAYYKRAISSAQEIRRISGNAEIKAQLEIALFELPDNPQGAQIIIQDLLDNL
jgi:hypothetical protein